MATLSRFSSPSPPPPPSFSNSNPNPNPSSNPKPNPEYVSPMLQKYLDQQDHQELGPPGIEEVEHEIRHDSVAHRDLNSGHISSSTPNSNNDHVDRPLPTVFHLSFNQDYGCFTLGTDRGFRIYNCEPFKLLFRRESDNGGGIGNVEMLFRCNIVALVGGGDNPQYPPTKLMIWDDHQGQCIGELTFRSEVRGVRLRKDRIVVVLELKIFVYNFRDLKVLHQIETVSNPRGLCEVSQVAGSFVLVCPGLQKGQVRVEHYASKRTKFILAHDSSLACFTLSRDGNLLATTSTKGTLVRIFNTQDGSLLQEVRRGVDRAEIHSLAFSSCSQWLAVSSDKGTIHVFSLKINLGNLGSENTSSPHDSEFSRASSSSSLSFIKGVLPKYFSSEWSVAQFRLPEGSRYIAAFGHEKNTVIVVGLDGSFYVCKFDPGAVGEMTQLAYHNFLKPPEGSQQ